MPGTLARTAIVLAYHERTKHRLDRYAAGPETLDWSAPPDPFRTYRGTQRVPLTLPATQLGARFCDLYVPGAIAAQPLSLDSLSALLQLSMALSAWKEYGPDRWAVRCNPSSGNLHPTEAYVVACGVSGLADGVYHYTSHDHALERRCTLTPAADSGATGRLWLGLSSIHWREAWKYGERAFRYCQLDIGHALGALRYAAGLLGWTLSFTNVTCGGLASLLGLDRTADIGAAECEEPELLVEVLHTPDDGTRAVAVLPSLECHDWSGQANVLDPHPMYHWPVIDEVAASTRQELCACAGEASVAYPPLDGDHTQPAAGVILGRRSAQRFDARAALSAAQFYRLLDCLLPRAGVPWDTWPFPARLHALLFVHRVEGLEAGLYALPRRPEAETELRAALEAEFIWRRPNDCPAHLPFYQLSTGDCRAAARTLSCHQAIAADSGFSLSLLAEFAEPLQCDPWHYRTLHWEAGLLGQVLYLEAEAAGLRGTGIGCYFDDAVHQVLGLSDARYQSLYHFTVGHPLGDERITTAPPYPEAR